MASDFLGRHDQSAALVFFQNLWVATSLLLWPPALWWCCFCGQRHCDGGYPIRERTIGFIDFNLPVEQLPVGTNHGTAQSVQHGPCCLITAQAQHALQSQRADTMLLAGNVPNGGEPDAKLSACFVKNGARSYRCLMPTRRTNQSTATASLNLRYHPTLRTNQPAGPA